jgi:hypothetical protein
MPVFSITQLLALVSFESISFWENLRIFRENLKHKIPPQVNGNDAFQLNPTNTAANAGRARVSF